jgi:hypothetical protein
MKWTVILIAEVDADEMHQALVFSDDMRRALTPQKAGRRVIDLIVHGHCADLIDAKLGDIP